MEAISVVSAHVCVCDWIGMSVIHSREGGVEVKGTVRGGE